MTKRSVGAVVVIDIPGGERKALLQLREGTDSFPGCAQLTVHGGANAGETVIAALGREAWEELHELFQRAATPVPSELENDIAHPHGFLHREGHTHTPREDIDSYSVIIHDQRLLELIQPLVDAGVLRLVTKQDLPAIVIVDPENEEHRTKGLGKDIIGMFADERRVLEHVLTTERH
jgi:hypothetical protein